MQVLITGAKGFIGQNLIARLDTIGEGKNGATPLQGPVDCLAYDVDTDPALLDAYCARADAVVHLAGVNRPKDTSEFMAGNFHFTQTLLDTLQHHGNRCPVLVSSSIQAALCNPYGESKKAGEDALFAYGQRAGAPVYVYRFPNVFGKWGRPNYNSAVATFCYNIARDLPITVSDPDAMLRLVYIDDVVDELIRALSGTPTRGEDGFCRTSVVHEVKLGKVAELIRSFKAGRDDLSVPDVSDALVKKLHATYLSYLPEDAFAYPLTMHADERGSFTEILRTASHGQFSVNVIKPGITKGNHWHNTKNEKFVVVSGQGVIRFRKLDSREVIEYFVSGERIEAVDIPVGYTHHIENLGDTDMVTFMWCNECFDPSVSDTYFLEV